MNWYCLHTKPLKESQVAAFCAAQLGLETYFPKLRQHRVIRRKRQLVTRPLFPRYFFCRFDPALMYRAVRYAPDVIDVVSKGAAPTIVTEDLIQSLRAWAGTQVDLITLQPDLRVGDEVQVIGGPMQGLSGRILKETNERNRVVILLSFLREGASLTVDRSDLRLTA